MTPFNVLAPVTFNASANVVTPVTFNVPETKAEAAVTPFNVLAPTTFNVLPAVTAPTNVDVPVTNKLVLLVIDPVVNKLPQISMLLLTSNGKSALPYIRTVCPVAPIISVPFG